MTPEKNALKRMGGAWLDFWFPEPPLYNLALMRMGTGLVLVYVLLVRSYDLDAQLFLLAKPSVMGALDQLAWPFSIFDWHDSSAWLWTVHIVAVTVAAAFLLGLFPLLSGALGLVFLLSYAHRNPTVLLGLDSLLIMAMAYLILVPCGLKLSVPGGQIWPRQAREPPGPRSEEPEPMPWSGLPFRVLQIHLCLLYFQAGLGKLNAAWLDGLALWHPRLLERGAPIDLDILREFPFLLEAIPAGLALFELFFGVLIWLRPLRYPVLALAVAVHLGVGIGWQQLPVNLLMIGLIVAFIRPAHANWLLEHAGQLLAFVWQYAMATWRAPR
ncbi:MAG: hypothetical protein O7E56_07995 [SAR324 cluster bacterium]|nr:hypothetical protein [SAR324 cluster bacterium]